MPDTLDDQLRDEFNRRAEAGRGEGMERDHLPIVEPMLALMKLRRAVAQRLGGLDSGDATAGFGVSRSRPASGARGAPK